jgi:hypothetical protein
MLAAMSDAPKPIFIIRHAEKPVRNAHGVEIHGVDIDGQRSEDSLIPLGWQRAGALVRLFDPLDSPRRGLAKPGQLVAPAYPKEEDTVKHRTHETITPLSELLKLNIDAPFKEGQEKELGAYVSQGAKANVVLISWEHRLIPDIAKNIEPLKSKVPDKWPEDRFDLVWSLAWSGDLKGFVFTSIPQLLLAPDKPM